MAHLRSMITLATIGAIAAGAAGADARYDGPDNVAPAKWERGALMEHVAGAVDPSSADAATAAQPRVIIYFDKHATRPGLPRDLGNTHRGRSIMLEYLQAARNSSQS